MRGWSVVAVALLLFAVRTSSGGDEPLPGSEPPSGQPQAGGVETVAERLAQQQAQQQVPSSGRFGRLRGSERFQREYETFDAEERKGHRFNDSLSRHEAHLETVARMDGHKHGVGKRVGGAEDSRGGGGGAVGGAEAEGGSVVEEEEEYGDVVRLIDAESNEYVMVRPHEGVEQMELQEDKELISDIVKVIVAAAVGGLGAGFLGQPVIIGFIVAGSLIGPGGLGIIEELVQVETLAQFGAIFLLFALGIEFSLEKLHPVRFMALAGGLGTTCILSMAGMGLALLLGGTVKHGVLIGSFVSMSSTAIVVKCLLESHQMETGHGKVMLGILLLQDCLVGLVLAMMPALASTDSGASLRALGGAAVSELLRLGGFLFCAWLLTALAVPRLLPALHRLSTSSAELYQLAVIAECLLVALASQHLGLSIEVGAFVAGLMLSNTAHSHHILTTIEPVRNLFAALFLSCIGVVMQPYFLWMHLELLLLSTMMVLLAKVLLTAGLVRLCGAQGKMALLVGVGLGQIGEFSFLLLSHAKRLHLLPKRMYLLMLGTTALSLLLTPLQWRLALYLTSTPTADDIPGRRTAALAELIDTTVLPLQPDTTPTKRE